MAGLLRHVNLFTWADGASAEAVAALGAELDRMAAEIPEVRSVRYGPDLRLMDGNVDFVVEEEFDDADAFRRYLAHPAHDRMVREFLRPILASRHAVQYELAESRLR